MGGEKMTGEKIRGENMIREREEKNKGGNLEKR